MIESKLISKALFTDKTVKSVNKLKLTKIKNGQKNITTLIPKKNHSG